jgi:lipopolysaccharide export system permease protein
VKIIPRYILKEHAGPLVFALSALTSIMLLNYIAKNLGSLVGKGLEWSVIAEFFALSVPFTVAMTLPMAVLVAVLYAFSRLAAENEITALRANGVAMGRLLTPVLIASVFFAVGMVAFNDQLLPRTNHRLRALQGDIARKKPTFNLRPQIINEVSPGAFFLKAVHIDPNTNRLRDVTIYDVSDQLRRHTIYADSGEMAFTPDGRDLKLTLYRGYIQEVPKEQPTQLQRVYYDVDVIRVANVANAFERDSSDTFKSDREMSVCELHAEVARFERDYEQAFERYRVAADLASKDPNAFVAVAPPRPVAEVTAAAQRPSLGRYYCNGLRYLERRGLARLTSFAWNRAVEMVLPRRVVAQASQPPTSQQGQKGDSARRDSLGRAATDSVRRADSTRQADSARRALAAPIVAVPDTSTLPPGVAMPTPMPQPPGVPPATVSPVPSAGISPTIPAAVEMETQRSQMLSARAQMNQYAVEIHKKFAISVACIVFVLLGAPIALRFPRAGVGLVIGVSLGVFALYYVGLIAGESLADRNILGPGVSMWAANIVFTLVGVGLLLRMNRGSTSSRGGDLTEWMERLRHLRRSLAFPRRARA